MERTAFSHEGTKQRHSVSKNREISVLARMESFVPSPGGFIYIYPWGVESFVYYRGGFSSAIPRGVLFNAVRSRC